LGAYALVSVVAIGLAVVTSALSRGRQRRWSRWLARENQRFVLRLHATGPTTQRLTLGTSLEDAAGPPDHEPTLDAAAVVLEDDAENRVSIPDGTKLRVRAFDGAHRAALGHETTRNGTLERRTFEVPGRLDFWILDAPGFGKLERPVDGGARALPARDAAWELTTRHPPVPLRDLARNAPALRWPVVAALGAAVLSFTGDAGALSALGIEVVVALRVLGLLVSWAAAPRARVPVDGVDATGETRTTATLARCESPMWTYRLRDLEQWFLPPRSSPGRAIVVDVVDPHSPSDEVTERDDRVGAAALALADELWVRTDLRAIAAVPVVVGRARLHRTNEVPSYDAHQSILGQFDEGPTVLVWGAAEADLGRDGYVLRVRAAAGPHTEEQELRGPLPALADQLVRWLSERGFCRAIEPPAHLRLPAADVPYCLALDRVFLQSLMHPRNRALPPLPAQWHEESLALAEQAVAGAPDSTRAHLARLVCAIYALEAGVLPAEDRELLLGRVRAASDPTDPLHRVAPMLLERLGCLEEGRALAEELRRTAGGPYRDDAGSYAAWLGRIGQDS